MKKIIFAVVAVLTISASVYCYTQKNTDVALSDLAMENVEALAYGEWGGSECSSYCTPDVRYNCYLLYGNGVDGITCTDHRKQ